MNRTFAQVEDNELDVITAYRELFSKVNADTFNTLTRLAGLAREIGKKPSILCVDLIKCPPLE